MRVNPHCNSLLGEKLYKALLCSHIRACRQLLIVQLISASQQRPKYLLWFKRHQWEMFVHPNFSRYSLPRGQNRELVSLCGAWLWDGDRRSSGVSRWQPLRHFPQHAKGERNCLSTDLVKFKANEKTFFLNKKTVFTPPCPLLVWAARPSFSCQEPKF